MVTGPKRRTHLLLAGCQVGGLRWVKLARHQAGYPRADNRATCSNDCLSTGSGTGYSR
jgi:hypothetical protein